MCGLQCQKVELTDKTRDERQNQRQKQARGGAHAFDSRQADPCEFKANLVYVASSRQTRMHGKTLFNKNNTVEIS